MRAPESSHSSGSTTPKRELDKEWGDHYQTSNIKRRCGRDLGPTALAASLQEVTFLHTSERTIPKVLHTIFCNTTNSYIQYIRQALDCLHRNMHSFSSPHASTFLHSPSPPPSCFLVPTLVLSKAARSWMDTRSVWTAKARGQNTQIHRGTGGRREGW